MKAKTFDRKFDSGTKIVEQLDLKQARRIGTDAKRVNVDFPAWMVDSLDREARRLGVTRQYYRHLTTRMDAGIQDWSPSEGWQNSRAPAAAGSSDGSPPSAAGQRGGGAVFCQQQGRTWIVVAKLVAKCPHAANDSPDA